MPKLVPRPHHISGAGKWLMVGITTTAAIIGLLVNARSLGLTPWLGLGGVSLADLEARRVRLAPAADTLTALGDTLLLAATVTDQHGATIAGATLVWSTDDSSVATVDSSGAVVAQGPGLATISAAVRDHVGRASVTVSQRVRSVVIGTDTVLRLPEGTVAQVGARVLDARRRLVSGRTVRWESADSTVVAITPGGKASAGAPGRTMLTASTEGASASVPAEVVLSPASARLLEGTEQRAPAGRRLPREVVVQVLSRGGRPVPGASVTFTAQEPQARADPEMATTDRAGRAHVAWTLGPQAGRQHLVVSAPGMDSTVVLAAEADPVPSNTRMQQAGEAAQGQIGTALAAPVGVRVTDSSGAAVGDVPVAWTAADGGTIEALAPRTDSLGQAWARWTLGRRAGPQRARVQVGNPRTLAPYTITATALPAAAAAVAVEDGADQDGTVGAALKRPIVVRLADRDNNAAAGATLRAVALSGSVPESLVTADARGLASVPWTLGRQAGQQWLELRAGEGAPVRVGARAHPLEPANLGATGAPHGAPAGRALPRPVVFAATDAYGNPVPDVQVVFTASAGSLARTRVMTDAKGEAAARWTLGAAPGEQTLTATVRGTEVQGAVTVRALKGARPSRP